MFEDKFRLHTKYHSIARKKSFWTQWNVCNALCIDSLPARASEQGNVIGSVRIYICVCIVIERTRDLIYLNFVATDFFPKIISLSAGENSGDLV